MEQVGFGLPAGTVTFLLTDVEGSTRLWEQRPDEMPDAVLRHYEILGDAIAGFGGLRPVEQGEGDSVVGVFARVADAVQAAAAAQRRLQADLPWLAVRIAVHTGEAQPRDDGNYAGRTVIRCARLRSCGHGGQILVSEAAAALVADDLPPDLGLVSLGVARLRDLSRSEHVWQLVHPDLRSTFPPLRTLDGAPHNLPIPLTSFVGRDAEQQAVLDLVHTQRLTTLAGSGGSGKSRLALHVAAVAVDLHPDGTWWVELASIASASEVIERIAASARLVLMAAVDPLGQLIGHWRESGRVLVVLDNAEHVLEASAAVAQRLLAECPGLRLLVTSREPLGVPGEVVWRVPSLTVPPPSDSMSIETLTTFDSVRLFIERAHSARPNLVIDDRVAPHIASICSRLDGIPLAIELAAARTRSLPLDRLALGLADAFRLLTGGARTVLPRQQTLLASIAWSVDSLTDIERRVFRRLGVFQSRFTLDAAEAVTSDDVVEPVAVLDVVARLVDKSLVQLYDESGRYGLLDTIRQFALDRLREAGELATTRHRHARWFAEWSDQVGRGTHGLGSELLRADMPDAVAALEWSYDSDPATAARICAGLAYFRPDLGASASLDRQCDWLVHFDRSSDPASWAIGVAGTALAASIARRADLLAICADARAALDPADRFHHRILEFPLAFLAQIRGDDSQMSTIVAEAVAAGDDLTVLAAAGSMALVATRSGYFSEARRFLDQVDFVLRRHETELDPGVSGFASQAALELAALTGDFVAADELAATMSASRSNWMVPIACQVAYLATMTGDGARVLQAASDVGREVPRTFEPVVHYLDSMVARLDRRWSDAADSGVRGWEGNRRNGALQGLFSPLVTTALLACGRIDEARSHVSNWGGVVERLGRRPLQSATFHLSGALVHLATGRDGPAVDEAHALLDVADTHGFALMRVDALELVAEVASLRGNDVLAARLLGATSTERRRIGYTARIRAEPDLAIERQHQVAIGEPVAFAEGAALSIDHAVELAQRARGERTRPTHGWDSLTPTEHKVIELVAEGLANSQIGAQLLMSTATVKSHLTHVFAKLGLANRTELAAEAHRHVE